MMEETNKKLANQLAKTTHDHDEQMKQLSRRDESYELLMSYPSRDRVAVRLASLKCTLDVSCIH